MWRICPSTPKRMEKSIFSRVDVTTTRDNHFSMRSGYPVQSNYTAHTEQKKTKNTKKKRKSPPARRPARNQPLRRVFPRHRQVGGKATAAVVHDVVDVLQLVLPHALRSRAVPLQPVVAAATAATTSSSSSSLTSGATSTPGMSNIVDTAADLAYSRAGCHHRQIRAGVNCRRRI